MTYLPTRPARSLQCVVPTVVLLWSLSTSAATLELEVEPGYVWSPDISNSGPPSSIVSSPILRARVGVDLGWFTPSVGVFTALFQDPGPPVDATQKGGLRAWGVAAQARFHSTGTHQFVAGGGVGWGQLIALQAQYGDLAYIGRLAPYVNAFAGYRVVLGPLRLGLELTLDGFNRVDLRTDFANPPCPHPYQCPTGSTMWLRSVALAVALDLP